MTRRADSQTDRGLREMTPTTNPLLRGELSAGPGRLFAVAENYSELKWSPNFLELQRRISALEQPIAVTGLVRTFINRSHP